MPPHPSQMCIIIPALYCMICFFYRINMATKWCGVMVRAAIGGRNQLTAWLCMLAEAERVMNGEMPILPTF